MCRIAEVRCVVSCVGVASGYYHSCSGCNKYVRCVGRTTDRNRPCPVNQIWDDRRKRCDSVSATCKPCSLGNDAACTKKGGVCVDICQDNSACQQGALYAGLCPGAATRRCCVPKVTVRSTTGPTLVSTTVETVTFAPGKVKLGNGKGKTNSKES